jgi:hypothetical protein
MKNNFKKMFLGVLVSTALIALNSCTKEQIDNDVNAFASILDVTEAGASSVIAGNLKSMIVASTAYDETELEILIHMKEEEKLARDVYSALSQKWDKHIFNRISQAENTHMNAIVYLLGNYGTDYTQVLAQGTFSFPEYQLLYNELVTKGSVSVEEAYKVGALVEEMDIADLIESLKNVTDENIKVVFENLEKGSRNHLRTFSSQLTTLRLTYIPVYLSTEEYTIIVNSPAEQGKKYRMNRNGNQNGNGKGSGNRNGNGNGTSGSGLCY